MLATFFGKNMTISKEQNNNKLALQYGVAQQEQQEVWKVFCHLNDHRVVFYSASQF